MQDIEEEASDWETASEEEDQPMGGEREAAPEVSEWDVRRSLFDNHVSADLAGNLEYMWKKFGFYLPDAEFLQDPDGLIKYLVPPPPTPLHWVLPAEHKDPGPTASSSLWCAPPPHPRPFPRAHPQPTHPPTHSLGSSHRRQNFFMTPTAS